MDLFSSAVKIILGIETGNRDDGAYHNDPHDPGGETKYGIAKASHPDVDIANLTVDQAIDIYQKSYWNPLHCDLWPWPVALQVFDCAVNQGVGAAAKCLQAALEIKQDGNIGPVTIAAVEKSDAILLSEDIGTERVISYSADRGWGNYKKGWVKRILAIQTEAVQGND
jgi:lysozyme family protein